jgi:hypothetical protein
MCTVHEITNGIPRLISQLSDHALLRAYVTEVRRVDRDTVIDARKDLDQSTDQRRADSLSPRRHTREYDAEFTLDSAPTEYRMRNESAENAETFVACTECEGSIASLEINTNALPVEPRPLRAASTEPALAPASSPQSRNGFVEEEVVVDPYAMMDAARTAAQTSRQPIVGRKAAMTAPTTTPLSCTPAKANTSMLTVTETVAPEAVFVESRDNAPVHEVGAGLGDRAATSTGMESPILVIEDRLQRITNQIARVDTPQQAGPGARGYRRLFTHARKS